MLPFYIYYSMFGFQRVGDAIWAAADQRARGFLLGATSGRTTLGGEGLQHQDGSSHLVAATIPNCKAYDPAFAGEMAVIVDHGMREMLVEQRDVFYYVTLMNENYAQPDLPDGAREGVIRGCYRFATLRRRDGQPRVTLLGSGAILTEVIKAAQQLAAEACRPRCSASPAGASWRATACTRAAGAGGEADGGPTCHEPAGRQRPGRRRQRLRARRAGVIRAFMPPAAAT
jgi:pyruvate dehydrogenase E1 component